MSLGEPAPGSAPPGGLPPAGWYPDPTAYGLLLWWDGREWTPQWRSPWPDPGAGPRPHPGRATSLLASRAGGRLLAAAATIAAAGWLAAASLLLATLTSGRTVTGPAAALGGLLSLWLPAVDLLAGIACLASRRARSSVALTDQPGLGTGKAWSRGTAALARTALGSLRPRRRVLYLCLPGPVGWAVVAALAVTAGSWCLGTFWAVTHGGFLIWPTVHGQQFAAIVWMGHLVTWCAMACRRLNRYLGTAALWEQAWRLTGD